MSYMVMQRYTTAIREAYAGRPDVAQQCEQAANFRAWLESLEIPDALRAELIEPIRAIEDAFGDVLRAPGTYARG
ncbi:MAG TPA: hypothetical protein VK838_05370 [Candidatus Limnocylindrales bacterium]|nr:hypothetical protein [Candidatus Limnocylindrales bacterium]